MMTMHSILRKILIAIFALFITVPVMAGPDADADEFGFATEHNQELVNDHLSHDLSNFGPVTMPDEHVPLEAKIGLAFVGGLSKVALALDDSLTNFVIIFILLAYAFWLSFEAYNLIGGGAKDAKETVKDILMKGIIISIWLMVLGMGLAKYFAMIMVPIVSIGGVISKVILDAAMSASGMELANTCDAIKNYAVASASPDLQTTAESVAGLLCIPSQMSAFFKTTMKLGWSWVIGGVGVSLFGALIGLYITWLSLKCIWRFLFISLSVVADLFLALMLLPFTAIAETTAKTNYKGVAGDIFNSFLGIFKAESLETQINRMIKAALYFVCLAVAVGVSLSLLSYVINPTNGQISTAMRIDGIGGVLILILALLLVNYMAEKSQSLAESWGGKIDEGIGKEVQKDVKDLWESSKKAFTKLRTAIKKQ